MYIPNDDTNNYHFCRLRLVVETFGHSTSWTNKSKFNTCPQSCWANEHNAIIKLWGLVLIAHSIAPPPWYTRYLVVSQLYMLFLCFTWFTIVNRLYYCHSNKGSYKLFISTVKYFLKFNYPFLQCKFSATYFENHTNVFKCYLGLMF